MQELPFGTPPTPDDIYFVEQVQFTGNGCYFRPGQQVDPRAGWQNISELLQVRESNDEISHCL